jgi:hypothetical protein
VLDNRNDNEGIEEETGGFYWLFINLFIYLFIYLFTASASQGIYL